MKLTSIIIFNIIFRVLISAGRLEKIVRDLYKKVVALEEEKYDWEVKLRKQDQEVSQYK